MNIIVYWRFPFNHKPVWHLQCTLETTSIKKTDYLHSFTEISSPNSGTYHLKTSLGVTQKFPTSSDENASNHKKQMTSSY